MEIIPIIREFSPNAVILVGSGTWSQDIHSVASNPLPFDNVMYTLHFYAGTHTDGLRERLVNALKSGTPVFVSEWGTSDASGGGGVYLNEAQKWLELLDKHNVSWINWSLCDKNEASAALKPGADPSGGWTENDLSESGRFIFARF